MRKRFWGTSIGSALILLIISSSAMVAQRRPGRGLRAAANDLKITTGLTTSGHSMGTTTMLKGRASVPK